jgi:hypothetical protein
MALRQVFAVALALAAPVVGLACGSGDDEASGSGGLAMIEESFVVDLEPVDNSRISGTADFRLVEGETQVTLNLTGAAGTALAGTLPAHIHSGTCGNLQPGVAYPLAPVGEHGSRTTLELTLDELQTDELALTVHQPGTRGKHVACGNIGDARAGTGTG